MDRQVSKDRAGRGEERQGSKERKASKEPRPDGTTSLEMPPAIDMISQPSSRSGAADGERRSRMGEVSQQLRGSIMSRKSTFERSSLFSLTAPDSEASEEKPEEWGGGGGGPQQIFMDAEQMKETVRRNLLKETYDVSKYYYQEGLWPRIATSPNFEKVTLLIIAFNAVWIGVDTDHNTSEVLLRSDPIFQIMEQSFCIFFAFEWFVRFSSFQQKKHCFRDGWFVFDSLLVLMMVMETWVLSVVMVISGAASSGGLGNASILRMARLARLTRMARMARLLRAMPELMILVKGIVAATRSVFFTLMLLCLLLYIFGIAFTQLTAGTDVHDAYFDSVADSMLTLLCRATLMDQISTPMTALGDESMVFAGLYLLYVLLATVTVMNMLIGVLCEVVSAVAAVERETLTVMLVKNKLQDVLKRLDEDGSGTISKEEFGKILTSRDAVEALNDVGVDVEGIADFADFLFADEDAQNGEGERELTFPALLDIVLQFRGCNIATVKDIIDLHKFVKQKLHQTTTELREIKSLLPPIRELLKEAAGGKGKDKGGGGDDEAVAATKSMAKACTCTTDLEDDEEADEEDPLLPQDTLRRVAAAGDAAGKAPAAPAADQMPATLPSAIITEPAPEPQARKSTGAWLMVPAPSPHGSTTVAATATAAVTTPSPLGTSQRGRLPALPPTPPPMPKFAAPPAAATSVYRGGHAMTPLRTSITHPASEPRE